MADEDIAAERQSVTFAADMRYHGQGYEIPVPLDADLRPRRAAARQPLHRPGDRHRVRLDHRRPARLRRRGGPLLEHPDHGGRPMSATAESLRIAEIPEQDVDPVTLD